MEVEEEDDGCFRNQLDGDATLAAATFSTPTSSSFSSFSFSFVCDLHAEPEPSLGARGGARVDDGDADPAARERRARVAAAGLCEWRRQ